MRSVLVTGASGLIGRRLLACLPEPVRGIALLRDAAGIPDGNGTLQGDLNDPKIVERLPRDVDTLVHLAQSRAYGAFPEQALDVFGVNVSSTARLLDWARLTGVRRVVLASTGGLYAPSSEAHKEDEAVVPSGRLAYYYATRRSAEMLAAAYAAHFTVVILRFFFVYGPGQAEATLVPRLVRSVAAGRPIELQGRDGMRFNPIHVDDAVRAVMRTLELGTSETINVAGPEVLTMRRVGEIIADTLQKSARFSVSVGAAPNDLIGDTSKMTQLLAAPTILFADGIVDVVQQLGP